MNEEVKNRLVGIGLILAGVTLMVTGHAIGAYFTGLVTGMYAAGAFITLLDKKE